MVSVMRLAPFPSVLVHASPRKRLWVGGSGLGLFLLTLCVGNGLIRPDRAVGRGDLGRDFLAFYTAATFVRDGRGRELYDLPAVRSAEGRVARAAGIDLGTAFGPWWNPPFYALALEPLTALPYGRALDVWRWVNLAAVAAACVLLGRMVLHGEAPDVHPGLRSAALVPLLVLTSMPFIQATGHGQNTGTSLLLLTGTVALWRAGRGAWAGVVGGLLFYKPQLAAVVAGVMVLDLGWAAVGGLAATGVGLVLVTAVALPGTLGDWVVKLPANVHAIQVEHPYLWDRHVTIKAFWRLLLQGTAAGEPWRVTTGLTVVTWVAVAGPLGRAAWRARGHVDRRDRLIAATVCGMPLLMPFYFDYDLLLLAVPLTLYAADPARDRRLTAAWVVLYAELFVNAPVAGRFHVGLAAAVLVGVTALSLRRVNRPVVIAAGPIPMARLQPLAVAA